MDPLLDYYLCSTGDEIAMVGVYGWDAEVLERYDNVQGLPFWQAVQLTLALRESERSPAHISDLFPLAAFMEVSEERIREFLGDEEPR